ncbi:hypothetical protein [Cryptosporangium japonicum]|uniref:Uncharacterized protein n=1 Tax=Cryptosporangium japonicum TaxID=80872 RepID=A0ABP3DTB5_9ACTN
MSIDDSDTRMTAEFAAYRERAVPTYRGAGGAAVRATVTKRRHRRRAAVAGALVLLVALGTSLLRSGSTEDRLVPAVAPSTTSAAAPTPTSTPAGPLDNTTIDFSALPTDACGGPTVRLRDGRADVRRLNTSFGYWVSDRPEPVRGDITGDGRPEWVAMLGCVGEGGGTGRTWVFALSGELPELTVLGPGALINTSAKAQVTRIRLDGRTVVLEFNGGMTTVHWDGSGLSAGRGD